MKEGSPMEDKKIYLLAELTIRPEFLEEVKALLEEALIPTLQEPGCEALYETGRKDDPHTLVFFEVFSSAAAHEFHLADPPIAALSFPVPVARAFPSPRARLFWTVSTSSSSSEPTTA